MATPLRLTSPQHGGVWWLHSEPFCRTEKAQHQSWHQAVSRLWDLVQVACAEISPVFLCALSSHSYLSPGPGF